MISRVLIVGTGGREHAIAKALHRSKHNVDIYAIGGWVNPGIEALGNIDIIDINSPQVVVEYAQSKEIDAAIIGSENQLEQGLADLLQDAGIFCVGPTKDLAILETDKVYARGLIDDVYTAGLRERSEALPHDSTFPSYNPLYKVFDNDDYSTVALQSWLEHLGFKYVVKAIGLRGGKGVKVSGDHLHSLNDADQYCCELLAQDGRVLVEEQLFGEEFTVLAFADGHHLINMPVVKDFKRLNDQDRGPNTGGMGCVSFAGGSAPFLTDQDLETAHSINKRILDCLPGYVGILYGSFMKTDSGVKVIEYNCRFGDPEAINVLELLESDFVDVLLAMKDGALDQLDVMWSSDAMVTNYVVAPGYPDAPRRVGMYVPSLAGSAFSNNIIFAKIVRKGDLYTQLASRSFAFWSRGSNMTIAFDRNRKLLELLIRTDNCFFRTDIGKQWTDQSALKHINEEHTMSNAYTNSGVNVAEGDRVVRNIQACVTSTWNNNVVSKFGDFAGMYNLNGNVLVTSTDGVGTKTITVLETVGPRSGFHSLGQDIVNHCVNDILVKGAEPLFFLDYFASSELCADYVTSFVEGAAKACRDTGCVLIGGETAEMPHVYKKDRVDIVGTIVGVTTPETIIDGPGCIVKGDIVIGLQSSGPHTNGYSLIRRVLSNIRSEDIYPHRCYLQDIRKVRNSGILIKGLCHITGGGWWGNLKRVLPKGLSVDLQIPRMPQDSVFTRVQYQSGIPDKEMLDVFNMGFGMLIFVDSNDLQQIMQLFDSDYAQMLGTVQDGPVPNIRIRDFVN